MNQPPTQPPSLQPAARGGHVLRTFAILFCVCVLMYAAIIAAAVVR